MHGPTFNTQNWNINQSVKNKDQEIMLFVKLVQTTEIGCLNANQFSSTVVFFFQSLNLQSTLHSLDTLSNLNEESSGD